ncbi:hypothetical protein FA048_02830 [Pedobacter polaris]|uniref:Carboxypeptidase-like regulatory domain-containing protein n=1 Tax=Pedobacter polaris TaxID=2571273 RepID=A0A4U1CYT3_9SPHI|nr:hypothetical protein [Pedobacter polaris]TKC12568.1 hypothetical protein FA048_02830 [Pedobacter polaris]
MRLARLAFFCTLFLFTFSSATIFAQEFMLNGVVFENGSKIRIALAEVSNLRNRYSVGSNDMGLFQIRAVIGDTIVVAKRGFNDKMIVLTSTKDIILQLNRSETTLNEVVINGQSKKQTLDAIRQDFKNKGSFYGGKPPVLSYFFSPLTAIYELFGRTPNNARRFNKMYVTELQNNQVDQLFNKSTINKNTGLEGKELEDFMVNYRPDYEKAKNWTVYDATKWIKDSYKNYTDTLKKAN